MPGAVCPSCFRKEHDGHQPFFPNEVHPHALPVKCQCKVCTDFIESGSSE